MVTLVVMGRQEMQVKPEVAPIVTTLFKFLTPTPITLCLGRMPLYSRIPRSFGPRLPAILITPLSLLKTSPQLLPALVTMGVSQQQLVAQSVETKTVLQQLLNNASPSFEGATLRFNTPGTYYYICSRNNNFTNRSQKGQLTVS